MIFRTFLRSFFPQAKTLPRKPFFVKTFHSSTLKFNSQSLKTWNCSASNIPNEEVASGGRARLEYVLGGDGASSGDPAADFVDAAERCDV